MNFFRRTVIATAPAALGVILFAGGASATTITGSSTAYGNIAAFNAGSSSSVSANQFNQTLLDAAIQAACPAGDTCSGSTLTEIDVSLTVNLTASLGVNNSNAFTAYAPANSSTPGTYLGGATSGTAIADQASIEITDPVTDGIDFVDKPTFSVATTNQFKTTCGSSGTPSSAHFVNCLAIAPGSTTYSGTGTDMETGSYTGDLSGETSTYVGSGVVSFALAGSTLTPNTLPNGVTIPTNSASITALTHGLTVTYDYSYTEVQNTPEPTTMALVGGALLAIGIIRKKRIS
jgi:hypothetical protein